MSDILSGFAVAILSGLGIGGGGLLVIRLVLFCGVEQLTARGINLVYFLFSSGAAMLVHLMRRRLRLGLIAFLSVFGALGAVGGSLLAESCEPGLMRSVFGVLLLVSGFIALIKH